VFGAVADAISLQASLTGMLLLPVVAVAFTLGLDDPLHSPA
jgi:hypothetical protein